MCAVQVMEHVVCGIEDLCGQWSHYYWKDKYAHRSRLNIKLDSCRFRLTEHLMHHSPLLFCVCVRFKKFNDRVLRRILLRDNRAESSIVSLYKKLELQNAIDILDTPMGDISAAPSLVSLRYVLYV